MVEFLVYIVEQTLKFFPSPTRYFLPHILRVKFDILKTKSEEMQIICREAKILKIQRKRRAR